MKQKILFVIGSLYIGGAERSLVTLLRNLDTSVYDITLFLFKKGGEFEKLVPEEVKIIYIKTPKMKPIEKLFYGIERIVRNNIHPVQIYWKYIKKHYKPCSEVFDFAIAYNQGFSTYFIAEYINAEKKYGWLNSDYVEAKYDVNLDIPYLKKIDGVIPVSYEAESVFKKHIEKHNFSIKTTVIKDIVDWNTLEKESQEEINFFDDKGRVIILSVARLAKPKGLELAIEACKRLVDNNYNVVWYVIGAGPEYKQLKRKIKKLNLLNSFFLLGAKSNPFPYIKQCDIYVQTSLFEGLGMTVIEASLLHKPIVITNFITASSLIKDGETGLICEMSPQSIANSIIQYIENPELMEKVIQNLKTLENKDKNISLSSFHELLSN